MSYLCVNYNVICKFSLKGLKALHQDNQEYLREHRWPPVWYLKDYDYYQRCINELNKELKLKTSRGRDFPSDDEGCLCFTGGKSYHRSSHTHAYSYIYTRQANMIKHRNATWWPEANVLYWTLVLIIVRHFYFNYWDEYGVQRKEFPTIWGWGLYLLCMSCGLFIFSLATCHATHSPNHHHNINMQNLDKVFSCWLLGKSKRNGVVTSSANNGDSNGTTAENQIFNSTANSMNHIDLEAEIDLNLWHPALGHGRCVV